MLAAMAWTRGVSTVAVGTAGFVSGRRPEIGQPAA